MAVCEEDRGSNAAGANLYQVIMEEVNQAKDKELQMEV